MIFFYLFDNQIIPTHPTAGESIQRRGILEERDLNQDKFAPCFSAMFFGCWAWFVGVAFNLSVQMTLTRPYLNAWGPGARTLLLVCMLLIFFSVLATYRHFMARRPRDPSKGEAANSQWLNRLVVAGQKLAYKGWVW